MTNVQEIQSKTILTPSKLPDCDFVLNPYVGCPFACLYCYASFMGRFVNESLENWGNYLYVKTNSVSLLEKEYKKLTSFFAKHGKHPSVVLSSVTDPYQPIEKRLRLVRGMLEILVHNNFPGLVGILTKSPLVLRDIDVFQQLSCEVGMTITSTDDNISGFLEVRAPPVTSRLETLARLSQQGIKTYAFVGPLLPHFVYYPEKLELLIQRIAETGVQFVYVEHMNVKPYILQRLGKEMEKAEPHVRGMYLRKNILQKRQELQDMVVELLQKYKVPLRLQKVMDHNKEVMI